MRIATRPYYCPMCGHREQHCTNHQGEIYCNCRACGSNPLYCAEIDAHAGLPSRTAVLRCYRFNLEIEAERDAYHALRTSLAGVTCYEVISIRNEHSAEAKHDGETVVLYNPDTWPDQFVANIGRLHRWKQYGFPNHLIKMGYWLEFTGSPPNPGSRSYRGL